MAIEGEAFAIVGALEAFPRRLAAREIKARGGELRRGISRQTDFAVFGRGLIESATAEKVVERIEEARSASARLLSEAAFLALLGLTEFPDAPRQLSTRQLSEQSGLDRDTLERLCLFDAFEYPEEPFSFRDLIAAKQFARLSAEGVDWLGLLRAVRKRRGGSSGGVANLRLERAGSGVVVKTGATISELSGQLLLSLPSDDIATDQIFDDAREAEEAGDWDRAVSLYRRCVEIEPKDPVVAFNLSHALLQKGERIEARRYLNKVLRLDPRYAEAWYNLAGIAREEGNIESARRHLRQAISADPGYPDPLYNLALLEFDAGSFQRAGELWEKYRELDPDSSWGKKAKYGLQLIGMITGSTGTPDVSEADRRRLAR